MVAYAIDVVKPRNNGERGPQRHPIPAAKIAVYAKGKDSAAGIGRAQAKAFYNAFHFFGVLQKFEWIVTL